MQKTKIIAVCGFQGAGKDTVADILIEKHGFERLSFASALKDIISVMFGWEREMVEGRTPESRVFRETIDEWWSNKLGIPHFTPRYALQHIGTEVFRNHFHQDIWLSIIEKKIEMNSRKGKHIIITDCRFTNEFELVKKMGGIIVQIHRGDKPIWFDDVKNNGITPNIHESEWKWIQYPCSYIISNNGTMAELEETIASTIL